MSALFHRNEVLQDVEQGLSPMAPSTSTVAAKKTVRKPQLQPIGREEAKRNILVLEDDIAQLQILTHHLEAIEFKVISASTVRAAQQVVREQPLHMAILDISLPDGSGLEVCEAIDNDAKLAGMPTIVLSSRTEADLVRKTRASGGCFFLSKPYDPNVLLAIIERALGTELQ